MSQIRRCYVRGTLFNVLAGGFVSLPAPFESFPSMSSCFLTGLEPGLSIVFQVFDEVKDLAELERALLDVDEEVVEGRGGLERAAADLEGLVGK